MIKFCDVFCLSINDLRLCIGDDGISRIVYEDTRVASTAEGELHQLWLKSFKTADIVFGSTCALNLSNCLKHLDTTLPNGMYTTYIRKTMKSVGVVLDNTLSWTPHEDYVITKVNRSLFGLRFIKPCIAQSKVVKTLHASIRYIFDMSSDMRISHHRSHLRSCLLCSRRMCLTDLNVMALEKTLKLALLQLKRVSSYFSELA